MNEKLRQARIDRRWSVDYAAKRIGVGRTTYMRWEQGTQTPYDSSLMMACKAFNLSPEQLGFGWGSSHTVTFENEASQAREATLRENGELSSPQTHLGEGMGLLPFSRVLIQNIIGTEVEVWQEKLYDVLEVEIIAMVLNWKLSSGPIAALQQFVHKIIRKHDAMHKDHDNHDARLTRRRALQAIAAIPIQLYGLSHVVGADKIPPSEVLPLCAAGLIACRELRQYEQDGMREIARTLSIYLPTLERLALRSSPQQREAAHLAGQGYLLVGILADHYGKLDHLEFASRTARRYGQLAQDVNLEATALARLAVKFDYERNDMRTLETYQEAIALSGFKKASPLIQGRIYGGLAGAHAYCLHKQEALMSLGRAQEVWPGDERDDPSYHFAYTGNNTLALWSGLALKHVGHYTEAAQAFLAYAPLQPVEGLFETNRAEFLNYAASVAVRQRELDTAYFYLDAAEAVAWNIRHIQRLAEVRDTLRSMQLLWPNEAKVKALQEKIYARQY